MIAHIKTVAVYVSDQAAALEFYTKTLGFEVRANFPMTPDASWLEVAPPGAQTAVVLYPRALMTDWANLKPSIVFHCADVVATHKELTARGVAFSMPPTQMKWGTYAKFADPDGNEFLLATSAN